MRRGLNLENHVREVVEKKLKAKVNNCGIILYKNYLQFGASPDDTTKDAVFEIKCPSSIKTATNYIGKRGEISANSKAQMQYIN